MNEKELISFIEHKINFHKLKLKENVINTNDIHKNKFYKEISNLSGKKNRAHDVLQIEKKIIELDLTLRQLFPGGHKDDKVNFCKQLAYSMMLSKDKNGLHLNRLNISAWLSICAPLVNKIPRSLEQFKHKFGDYKKEDQWFSELHLNSMVKHKLRRIYRNPLANIVVAETLSDNGVVEETEIIKKSKHDEYEFLSYNKEDKLRPFGVIENHHGKNFLSYNPQSCFGCHYNFDTHKFNIVSPSAKALNLKEIVMSDKLKFKRLMQLRQDEMLIVKY